MTFGYWVIPLIVWFCVWFGIAIADDKDTGGYLVVATIPVVLAVITRCLP